MTPVLLDITRTVSRGGRGPATGIDRVERAYIRWAMAREGSIFITRLGQRVALVTRETMPDLLAALDQIDEQRHWPLARFIKGKPRDRRAEMAVRRIAHAAARWPNIRVAIRALLGDRFTYINVGHTHLHDRALTHLRDFGAERIVVMVHDTIPLDYPKTQTTRSVKNFRNRLGAAQQHADHIITSARATAMAIRAHMPKPDPVVIPPGVEPPCGQLSFAPTRLYFVQLGTIEPRKNTHLLLDVWETLIATMPEPPALHLIGARGWMADEIFRRIEALSDHIEVHHNLSDAQSNARIREARALLFPTLAEGFGYPLFEALQLGVPVIASDLPVFRELAPVGPLYLQPDDVKSWVREVEKRTNVSRSHPCDIPNDKPAIPRWPEHFERIERLL